LDDGACLVADNWMVNGVPGCTTLKHNKTMLNVHFEIQKKQTFLVKHMHVWKYGVMKLVEVQH